LPSPEQAVNYNVIASGAKQSRDFAIPLWIAAPLRGSQ
jgi:hypothetical protein